METKTYKTQEGEGSYIRVAHEYLYFGHVTHILIQVICTLSLKGIFQVISKCGQDLEKEEEEEEEKENL